MLFGIKFNCLITFKWDENMSNGRRKQNHTTINNEKYFLHFALKFYLRLNTIESITLPYNSTSSTMHQYGRNFSKANERREMELEIEIGKRNEHKGLLLGIKIIML